MIKTTTAIMIIMYVHVLIMSLYVHTEREIFVEKRKCFPFKRACLIDFPSSSVPPPMLPQHARPIGGLDSIPFSPTPPPSLSFSFNPLPRLQLPPPALAVAREPGTNWLPRQKAVIVKSTTYYYTPMILLCHRCRQTKCQFFQCGLHIYIYKSTTSWQGCSGYI